MKYLKILLYILTTSVLIQSNNSFAAARTCKKVARVITENKELQVFYNFFKFMSNERVDVKLFNLVNFKKNEPKIAKLINKYGKLGDITPSEFAQLLTGNKVSKQSWAKHILSAKINLKENEIINFYDFFRFMKENGVDTMLFYSSSFQKNNPEIIKLLKKYGKLSNLSPDLIYQRLRRNKYFERTWEEHILEATQLDLAKHKRRESKLQQDLKYENTIELIYEFFRFMVEQKAEISWLSVESFAKNNKNIVKLLKKFKKLNNLAPSTIKDILIGKPWEEHFKNAKIDLKELRRKDYEAKKLIKLNLIYEFLTFMKENNAPVNLFLAKSFISNDSSIQTLINKFKKLDGMKPSSIYTFLKVNYKDLNWHQHLEKADIDIKQMKQLQHQNKIKEKTRLIYAFFKFMKEKKVDKKLFDPVEFRNNKTEIQKLIIEFKLLGKIKPRSIHTHLYYNYKDMNWADHLLKSDTNLKKIKKNRQKIYFERKIKTITDFIFFLQKENISPQLFFSNKFRENHPELVRLLKIYNTTEFKTPRAIFDYLSKNKIDWEPFLLELGINLKPIRTQLQKEYVQNKLNVAQNFIQVVAESKQLHNLSRSSLRRKHIATNNSILKNIDKNNYFTNPSSIYDFVSKNYRGGWDKFLSDNNINPDYVRLIGFAHYWKLSPKFKALREELYEREERFFENESVSQYKNDKLEKEVVDAETPESLLEKNEISQSNEQFSRLTSNLSEKQTELMDVILHYLETPTKTYEDLTSKDFFDFYKEESGKTFEVSELANLFETLKNSENTDF